MITKKKDGRVRKRVRKPTAPIRLEGKAMKDLRYQVYFRDGGICQLRSSPKCWGFANWEHGHLAHILSRGAGGADTPENTRWACRECHLGWEHNGGKPCPKKEL